MYTTKHDNEITKTNPNINGKERAKYTPEEKEG